MPELAGKVAIVTGASRGIGAATAQALTAAGASVMLAARSLAEAEANAQQLTAAGGKAFALTCDVSDYTACEHLVHETTRRLGPPDILVNNAGVIEPISTVADAEPLEWARSIEINLISRIPREQLTPVAHPARAVAYLCTKEADDLAGREFSLRDEDFRRRIDLG